MQLVDFALGKGQQCDVGERELLVQTGDVLLVARQPAERFGGHDVETARPGVLKHLPIAGPERCRAAQRRVSHGCPV